VIVLRQPAHGIQVTYLSACGKPFQLHIIYHPLT
jgi:hypothetical protein